ncbi:MAG: flagellar hook-associated protein FlgL [candidate division KSB1 bacterium]|nr:flagellar hook-associated protein FlgL [candidate division KSB1 bacterium]
MRITSRMLVNNLLAHLHRSLQRIDVHQEQIASGNRINRPSDDPAGTAKVLRLRDAIGDNRRFLDNVADGQHWLTVTEAALADSVEIFTQLRSRILQAQNDTLTAEDRRTMSGWVAEYLEQLTQVANRQEQGKYVFAGTHTTTPPYLLTDEVEDEPFVARVGAAVLLDYTELATGTVVVTDESGTTYSEGVDYQVDYTQGTITALSGGGMNDGDTYYVSYQLIRPLRVVANAAGSTGELRRQVGEAAVVTVNVRAPEAFGASNEAFDVLRAVKNALVRDDHEGLRQGLSALDAALDRLLEVQSRVGVQYEHLAMTHDRLSNEAILLERLRSQVADTDVAEAVVKLQEQKTSYQAALSVTASISQISLLDYLK